MIETISIENLGVIAQAELPLGPGLTALTGETGAGKTMVLTSLKLLLGSKADPAIVRAGTQRCVVEGAFALEEDAKCIQIAQGGFCTIRRIATACRRRVAALMLQFPTHHPSHGPDRHQRRPTRPRPRTSQSPATTGGNFVLHQLFRQREIKPIHFVQTVTN